MKQDVDTALIGRRGRPSSAETRERMASVLRAARTEFAQHGLHGATMESIAKRAGVSKRSLYLWHADKAALFCAVVIDSAHQLRLPELDPTFGLYEGLLEYGVAVRREFSTEYSLQVARLFLQEGGTFPEIYKAVDLGAQHLREPVHRLLECNGFERRTAERLAKLFMWLLLSDVQQAAILNEAMPSPKNAEDQVKLAVRIFVTGIAGERKDASSAPGQCCC